MAGCFGNSFEDQYRERELFRYLDQQDAASEPEEPEFDEKAEWAVLVYDENGKIDELVTFVIPYDNEQYALEYIKKFNIKNAKVMKYIDAYTIMKGE